MRRDMTVAGLCLAVFLIMLGMGAASLAAGAESGTPGRQGRVCGACYPAWGAGCFVGPLSVDALGAATGTLLAGLLALAAALRLALPGTR